MAKNYNQNMTIKLLKIVRGTMYARKLGYVSDKEKYTRHDGCVFLEKKESNFVLK